jgi:hypothetical protein
VRCVTQADIESIYLEADQGYCTDIRDEYIRHFLRGEFVTGAARCSAFWYSCSFNLRQAFLGVGAGGGGGCRQAKPLVQVDFPSTLRRQSSDGAQRAVPSHCRHFICVAVADSAVGN